MKLLLLISLATLFQADFCEMVGGWSEVKDTNSDRFQKMVTFVVDKFNNDSNSEYLSRSAKIENATKQVVAGMNYRFTITLEETKCKKNENVSDLSQCKVSANVPARTCKATVYNKPWMNETKLTGFKCDD